MTTSNVINEETIERARKRVRKMSQTGLLDWAEVAIPGMMKHLDYFRRTGDTSHLMEMAFAEMQLAIVLNELVEHQAARKEEGLTPE